MQAHLSGRETTAAVKSVAVLTDEVLKDIGALEGDERHVRGGRHRLECRHGGLLALLAGCAERPHAVGATEVCRS